LATIIRASAPKAETRGSRESLGEVAAMAETARRCLEQAQAEAESLLEDARQEAVRLRDAAIEEGRRIGREEAAREIRSELDQQLADAPATRDQVVAEIRRAQEEWFACWERDALRLACVLAARLVRRECIAQPQLTVGLVREALELAANRQRIRLLLHPADLDLLGDEIGRLLASLGRREIVEVVGDSAIEAGSCRVLTEQGEIDQQWTAQLNRLCDELSAS
jgi:flagellar assembly protein FliH